VQSLIAGDSSSSSQDEGLIVSQSSFDTAKAEYEDLITVKIPENKEAIATAREHGDLKENSEYKMARQDQDILLSRKNELEVDLSRARVTDFSEVTNENIGIGSVVELKEGSSGKKHRYAILGAWDSDPKNDILSYKTPLAQQLLGKKSSDQVSTKIGGNTEDWTILKIERWIDQK
jgi:transcription elongation factor GreA